MVRTHKSIEDTGQGTLIRIRVQPRASRTELRRSAEGMFRLAVSAPPVDDAANSAAAEFLAKMFRIGKNSIIITSGSRSRDKTFLIQNISCQDVLKILETHVMNA